MLMAKTRSYLADMVNISVPSDSIFRITLQVTHKQTKILTFAIYTESEGGMFVRNICTIWYNKKSTEQQRKKLKSTLALP
jgi:hypothetical protein